jgi:hypothetical protein
MPAWVDGPFAAGRSAASTSSPACPPADAPVSRSSHSIFMLAMTARVLLPVLFMRCASSMMTVAHVMSCRAVQAVQGGTGSTVSCRASMIRHSWASFLVNTGGRLQRLKPDASANPEPTARTADQPPPTHREQAPVFQHCLVRSQHDVGLDHPPPPPPAAAAPGGCAAEEQVVALQTEGEREGTHAGKRLLSAAHCKPARC